MTTHRIRPATTADYPAYLRLVRELGVDDAPYAAPKFEAEMMATTVVAERDGSVDGYAHWRVVGADGHLGHLVTAPNARRIGLGRALIAAASERMKEVGCTSVTLNVRTENTPAVRLYESLGFRSIFASRAIRLQWSVLDACPSQEKETPVSRAITPADDARLEAAYQLTSGTLAIQRAREGRVLRFVEDAKGLAFAVFDPTFPGVYPFYASDADHAIALLHELRAFARPGDPMLNLALEQQRDLANDLIARGATLRFEMERMRVAI